MLIQLSISNFKIFKEKATLNLTASNYDKETREDENIIHDSDFDLRLTKSAVLYGANSSGKSKFFEAVAFMKSFAINSSKDSQKGDLINIVPFKLDTTKEDSPSEFEVIFLHNREMYRYGFEVSKQAVVAEWLYFRPKTKEIEIFYRDRQQFDFHAKRFTKGNTLIKENLVRENVLLLSVAAQFNDKI